MYNYDPITGAARTCGTAASLCGVEAALEQKDAAAMDLAIKRILLLHSAASFCKGFLMLNSGDEIGQLNGWDYHDDPDRADDSRNLHRTAFNWHKAALRRRPGTLQNRIWQGLTELRKLRAHACFAPDAAVTTWGGDNLAVLAMVRRCGGQRLVGLFNFSEQPQTVRLDSPETLGLEAAVTLAPYEAKMI